MTDSKEMIVLTETVRVRQIQRDDYISLTDIAKSRNADDSRFVIQNWMRTRFTVEFWGIWEQLNNPDFNRVEFEAVKNESAGNAFVMTPTKWATLTGAIGIVSKSGRYGGTYVHKDIAFEFVSWVSVEFKLYLIKEFQRLKERELQQLGWDIRRNLSKINYRIHTDASKAILIQKLMELFPHCVTEVKDEKQLSETSSVKKELARFEPLRVVFRDTGFVSDTVKINAEQIFQQMSPGTEVKSI
jgi:hypothetical protein